MGLLALNLAKAMLRDRRRRQIQEDRSILIASVAKRKGSPCQQADNSQGGKIMKYSGPDLPEDIWRHIHSLMPLQDAARAGCVSRSFLRSWRCHPNLTFNIGTLGLKRGIICGSDKQARDFTNRVDHIMKNHSVIGLKTFKLEYCGSSIDATYLNSWLQIAVTPAMEELTLSLPLACNGEYYNFPCSLLFNGSGNSIQDLQLRFCDFHPMAGLACLRKLDLCIVHITGDELGCLLSNSPALEVLNLRHCKKIICLKIPCLLHRLSDLTVFECTALEVIQIKAPELCTLRIDGALVQLSLGDSLQVKELDMLCIDKSNLVHYARAKLPSIMPNLETLSICSTGEMVNTPIVPAKFLHLKYLDICLHVWKGAFSPAYDYFSLVSFVDACPVLETFILSVAQNRMKHDSIIGDSSLLRHMPEHHHDKIKNVKIIGFCSAKSMVELTCHILKNATSLECLTLDTIYNDDNDDEEEDTNRSSIHESGECSPINRHMVMVAHKALLAIKRYIVGEVPPTVKLNVKEPCTRCHAVK